MTPPPSGNRGHRGAARCGGAGHRGVRGPGHPPRRPSPPPVEAPGPAPMLGGGTPPAPGVDVATLEFLIADAAARAQQLLADALSAWHPDNPPPQELTVSQDAVRLATARPDGAISRRLAAGSGRDVRSLGPAVRAWEVGGPAGLAVLEEDRCPEPDELARATDRLAAAWQEGDAGRGCGPTATAGPWSAGMRSCATGGTVAGGRSARRAVSGPRQGRPVTTRRARSRRCRPRAERRRGCGAGRRPASSAH